jgi:glycosyltransferase involved in cell wall biosynthesis
MATVASESVRAPSIPAGWPGAALRILRYYPRAISGDGGMTNAVRKWSEGMVRAGAEVVIAYDDGDTPAHATGVGWNRVRHLGGSRFRMPVGLRELLPRASLLVLHSAWTPQNVWAGRLAKAAGIPYVLEPRGAYDPHIVDRNRWLKRGWWLMCERELVMNARAVHVFFPSERFHLQKLGYSGDVIIAPNGVSTPSGIVWDGGTGGYILWMGRFDPEHKGIDALVHAVHTLPEGERPELRLHGPEWQDGKQRVAGLISALGVQRWVKIGNAVHGRAKFELLARAAGFVYPSRWEGFGNSVAEAVSVGVPTLVTPYPFGKYLHERGGAILADNSPESLAAGLCRLRSPQAHEIASRGAEIVRNEITWDKVARSWLDQVKRIL